MVAEASGPAWTKLCCLGITPGKSPFRALARFPLQSGQGWASWSKNYIWPSPHERNTPAKFQPNLPRDHGSRPSPCTWNARRTPGVGPGPI